MVDTHTFLVLRHFIVVENAGEFFTMILQNMGCPEWLIPICGPVVGFLLRGKVIKRIAAGVGLMSNENYREILRKDFDALQTLLDQQKFFGGEHVTTTDCSVFGHLATTLYIPHDSYAKDLLKEQYPALVEYCDRVKETVFVKEFASE
ncbi:hypothetical protein OESDEN_12374 [Oesophagostomum dentatum]|uniref:Metaxin glutathione S-transferase domain-containing protein n=1 Tax=Oesophagostomum dentatum TaxID=61180 RepID=A0A0B1SWD9_OESDE|nr:hypothetical protein OESDEN_12374 [Oesophagostomum dentatum]